MAAPRISVVLVVAGVLAAAGGAAYYFFAVFSADERLREARAQVEKWEESWQAARRCILGEAPAAASIDDAITGRALLASIAPERGDDALNSCRQPISRLTRPEGNNTGIERVEEAWLALEGHASAVARSYVSHLAAPARDTTFAAALDQLVAARAALRKSVELSADDGAMGPAPHELQLTPLAVDGAALTELLAAPAGAQLTGRAAIGDRWLAVRIRRGQGAAPLTVEARPLKPDVVAAQPDAGWGAAAVFESKGEQVALKLTTGALDADGGVTAAAVAASAPQLVVSAALGAGQERAVLYVDSTARAALSRDGGTTWKISALAPSGKAHILASGLGHADVVWSSDMSDRKAARPASDEGDEGDEDGGMGAGTQVGWRRVVADQLPALGATTTLPHAELLGACPAPAAPWVIIGQGNEAALLRLDAPEARARLAYDEGLDLLGCDDDAVLLAGAYSRRLLLCRRAADCAPLAGTGEGGVGGVVAGDAVYAVARRHLAALITPRDPPRLVRLPDGAELRAVVSIDGSPYLVLKQQSGALAAALLPR